jgi:hypothetical protein
MQSLQRLTQDDSRRVAAAAQRLFDEEAAKPTSSARAARRRVIPAPAPARVPASEDATAFQPTPIAQEPPVEAFMPPAIEPAPVAVTAAASFAASTPSIEPALEPIADLVAGGAEVVTPSIDAQLAPVVPGPAPIATEPFETRTAFPSQVAPAPQAAPVVVSAEDAAAAARDVVGDASSPRLGSPAAAAPSTTAAVRKQPTAPALPVVARAASRAAIGSVLGMLFEFFWALTDPKVNVPGNYDQTVAFFEEITPVIAISTTLLAVVATALFSAPTGLNRWLSSAIVGGVAGLTVANVVETSYLNAIPYPSDSVWYELTIALALGFLVAEVIVGRLFTSRPDRSPPTG